eukprot:TRINITY_DN3464_c0_g1_i1.p1 TRINITY_DN3464_c0_g1~~TRINITY_DN3464_c0_g1_i1.p1  ORF type:complete len:340 (-),score=84.58 TRINITY_DN3464_c0_g1_i1:21-1040(-)
MCIRDRRRVRGNCYFYRMASRGRKRKVIESDSDDDAPSQRSQRGSQRAQRGSSQRNSQSSQRGSQRASQGRPRKRSRAGDEDGDFASAKQKKVDSLSKEEKEKLVGELMRLTLFLDHNKLPLKRADINQKVLKEYKGLSSYVLEESQKRFKEIFGYELKEIPRVEASVTSKGKGGKKTTRTNKASGIYVLQNLLTAGERQKTQDPQKPEETGLLLVLLSLIYLNDDRLDSDTLESYFKIFDIYLETEHPVFGDVKKLLDTYVKQYYLFRTKTETISSKTGRALYEYKLGGRAHVEIQKKELLRFIAGMFGEELDSMMEKEIEESERQAQMEDDEEEGSE